MFNYFISFQFRIIKYAFKVINSKLSITFSLKTWGGK